MSSRWQEGDHSNEDAATTFHCPDTVLSPRTVNTHLRHVFARLGVPDRAPLAAVVHHSIR